VAGLHPYQREVTPPIAGSTNASFQQPKGPGLVAAVSAQPCAPRCRAPPLSEPLRPLPGPRPPACVLCRSAAHCIEYAHLILWSQQRQVRRTMGHTEAQVNPRSLQPAAGPAAGGSCLSYQGVRHRLVGVPAPPVGRRPRLSLGLPLNRPHDCSPEPRPPTWWDLNAALPSATAHSSTH
jgi:hypothetical protein